jgi:hypothetical protein
MLASEGFRQETFSMETGHSSALSAKHAGLESRIHAEQVRPAPDETLLAKLKKQKLRIKEALSGE